MFVSEDNSGFKTCLIIKPLPCLVWVASGHPPPNVTGALAVHVIQAGVTVATIPVLIQTYTARTLDNSLTSLGRVREEGADVTLLSQPLTHVT